MKKILAILAGIVMFLSVSACGQAPWEDSLKDYEGANVTDPDKVILLNNVDKHPNIVILCYKGYAFETTTREGPDAVNRFEKLDALCK